MKCDNRMCIYEDGNMCKCPNQVEIDWHGLCKNMVPTRITQEALELNKLYTKTVYEHDEEYYFDKETGQLEIKDEFLDRYDCDINF